MVISGTSSQVALKRKLDNSSAEMFVYLRPVKVFGQSVVFFQQSFEGSRMYIFELIIRDF